jgi:hypothetical protein
LCKLPSDFNKEKSYDPTRNPTCDEGRCDYKADVKCMERGSGLAAEQLRAKEQLRD